jgi:hypothetical protein
MATLDVGVDGAVERPQPRKLIADAAHLGVDFGDQPNR